MNKVLKIVLLCALLAGVSMAEATPDAHALLKHADQARGGALPGIVWDIRLKSRDGEKIAEEQSLKVSANDDASVAEVIEPVRSKSTKLLQVGRSMWLTKPGLSKPLPISPRQRMSGQASNGDIAATNYAGDYDAQVSSQETLDGEVCYVLDLKAKHNRTTYDRIRYWIAVNRGVGVKAEFYSVSGKLIKTAVFEYNNTIEHEGKRTLFVSKMTIRDAFIDAETTMEFGSAKVKKIAASEFDLGQIQ
jgi:hypothetical protein